MLHAIYQMSSPYGFREDDVWTNCWHRTDTWTHGRTTTNKPVSQKLILALCARWAKNSLLLLSIGISTRKNVYCSFHIRLSDAFRRLLFLLLVISSWNFHDLCHVFYITRNNFSLIRQKTKNFPNRPSL